MNEDVHDSDLAKELADIIKHSKETGSQMYIDQLKSLLQ